MQIFKFKMPLLNKTLMNIDHSKILFTYNIISGKIVPNQRLISYLLDIKYIVTKIFGCSLNINCVKYIKSL